MSGAFLDSAHVPNFFWTNLCLHPAVPCCTLLYLPSSELTYVLFFSVPCCTYYLLNKPMYLSFLYHAVPFIFWTNLCTYLFCTMLNLLSSQLTYVLFFSVPCCTYYLLNYPMSLIYDVWTNLCSVLFWQCTRSFKFPVAWTFSCPSCRVLFPDVSLIVPEFTISVYGSSCNY